MKFRQWVNDIPEGTMIAVGAKSSFLYIAPKEELLQWMLQEKNRQFFEREVISFFYDIDIHKGYVVKIEGMESGKYAIRWEVAGGRLSYKLETFSEGCGLGLLSKIIAEYVHDISDYDIINKMYFPTLCNNAYTAERRKLLILAIADNQARFAKEFLIRESANMYSPIPAETLIRYGHLNACMKMQGVRKEILRQMNKTDEEVNIVYTLEQQDMILNLFCAGYASRKILEIVGKGKNNWGTTSLLERVRANFKNRMEAEAKRYFREREIPSGVQLRENLTYKGESLNA